MLGINLVLVRKLERRTQGTINTFRGYSVVDGFYLLGEIPGRDLVGMHTRCATCSILSAVQRGVESSDKVNRQPLIFIRVYSKN